MAQVGAFYERYDDTIEQSGFEQETDLTRFRPFVRLTLRSPWCSETSAGTATRRPRGPTISPASD